MKDQIKEFAKLAKKFLDEPFSTEKVNNSIKQFQIEISKTEYNYGDCIKKVPDTYIDYKYDHKVHMFIFTILHRDGHGRTVKDILELG